MSRCLILWTSCSPSQQRGDIVPFPIAWLKWPGEWNTKNEELDGYTVHFTKTFSKMQHWLQTMSLFVLLFWWNSILASHCQQCPIWCTSHRTCQSRSQHLRKSPREIVGNNCNPRRQTRLETFIMSLSSRMLQKNSETPWYIMNLNESYIHIMMIQSSYSLHISRLLFVWAHHWPGQDWHQRDLALQSHPWPGDSTLRCATISTKT